MQLTLKELHRFQASVQEAITQLGTKITRQAHVTVSAYDQDIEVKVGERREEVQRLIDHMLALQQLRFRLRREVQVINTREGIDELLTRVAGLQALTHTLRSVLPPFESRVLETGALAALKAKFKSIRDNPTAAVAREDEVQIPCVLQRDDVEARKAQLAGIKREVQRVQDRIATINAGSRTDVSLSTAEQALLTEYNIFTGAGA